MDGNNSDMDEEEINKMVEGTIPQSTKRSTEWGFKVFQRWTDKRNVNIDVKTVNAEDLANALRKFYAEVKKQDGGMYTPSALVGIRAAIHRKLISPPNVRNINILEGP